MKSFLVRLSSLVGFTGGLFVVLPAAAQPESECADNSDCEAGYECQVTGVSGCAAPTPTDCAPGEDCMVPPPPDCETMEYSSCVPLSGCESDADCAGNMVCLGYEMGSCSDVACAPGEDCPDIEPMCETSVQTQCTERWNAPCETADDCGAGFECEYYEECSCAGSGGVNPSEPTMPPSMPQPDEGGEAGEGSEADAQDPPEAALPAPLPPEEPTCECQPSAYGSCKLIEVECEEDSDCPSDWSCQQQYQDAPCGAPTEPAMMGGGTAGTGASGAEDVAPAPIAPPEQDPVPPEDGMEEKPAPDVDGGAAPAMPVPVDCEPLPAKSVCMPPGYYGSPATPTPGPVPGDDGGENTAGEEPQDPIAPSEPSTDDEDDAPGAAPDAGVVTVTEPVEPEDEEPAETDDETNADDKDSEDDEAEDEDGKDEEDGPELAPVDDADESSDDGCNVAASGAGSTSGAMLTGLLGLVGLALMRRRRG